MASAWGAFLFFYFQMDTSHSVTPQKITATYKGHVHEGPKFES